ncbi:MAG: 3-hydroxyacyl-CoA dehydrogenase NAD-binding domain-containing protein [Myxococcota bacterium]|nr:3-hydroxyacyl-CoA dehydrogenase NAD-binding domain-containing protein [Myxococcota bacterium]
MTSHSIHWSCDADRVVTITFDEPGRPVNTIGEAFGDEWFATVQRLVAEKESIAGVIVTSGKDSFLGGADLNAIVDPSPDAARRLAAMADPFKRGLRTLETFGRPVVAALNGSALGGGYEVAMACHHRIAVRGSKAKFGLPEVTLGLLPGAGIARSVRLFGLVEALQGLLLTGASYSAEEALERTMVSELVDAPGDLAAAAKRWIAANPNAAQPWDRPGFRIRGGTTTFAGRDDVLGALPALLRKQTRGAPLLAPRVILDAAVECTKLDFEGALKVESRAFLRVLSSQQAKNMTQAFFFDAQELAKGATRPAGIPRWQATKLAVLGAGMMGAGIAYQAARSGLAVVLKDVSLESAERGKDHARKLLGESVERGRMTQPDADAVLARITPTADTAALAGCDAVIEAVFEEQALKTRVFGEVEPVLAADALLASNTSQIPITALAEAVSRPADFVGLHFFSPVEKMPLVEVVAGKRTSPQGLARAIDLVQQLRFVPLVVHDSRGFFTTRVILQFAAEAFALVLDGAPPAAIERAATMAGYPVGPLQLVDELNLRTARKVIDDAKGHPMAAHPGFALLDRMLANDRAGRLHGRGFYDYDERGRRLGLWRGLGDAIAKPCAAIPVTDMQDRMMCLQALDAVRCFDEGVIASHATANVASIRAIGFPAWTGGVVNFVDQYEGGTRGFVARCRELATAYGERFAPPASLVRLAETGAPFRPRAATGAK